MVGSGGGLVVGGVGFILFYGEIILCQVVQKTLSLKISILPILS